jgi:SAM-dependent methyltransferase
MDLIRDLRADEAHFKALWEHRSAGHAAHTRETWDERADEWEDELRRDPVKSASARERVEATGQYLRARGLLGPGDDVIDIGCGPGRFVAEFARTCRSAVGTDLSGRMLEHGAAYTREQGLSNTSFVRTDFHTADLDALGWRKRFDLVFTSITPAISGVDSLQKVIHMSRGFCFNSCFVRFEDDLLDRFRAQTPGPPPADKKAGHWHWFYTLFNLLLLWGYAPETTYYDDCRTEALPVTREAARHLARGCAPLDAGGLESLSAQLYDFMVQNQETGGVITRRSTCTYGWILWDTRRRLLP